ncbi:hypothetical protein C834K_0359 [Chlamydia poikilotherma]|uniref:Uncharacterized protein n=1 Tax=Chlamydia poikilotherma TaxID=1967783 RepID=A0A3B0QG49_9CHLA|nr:hypothetical protein [Chlamydia poikilotherma]SYX08822.1 hypothetical protein C834K_0359 [Chlamydia poikilotherma]
MPLISTIIPAHVHTNEDGYTSDIEASSVLHAPRYLMDPDTKLHRVQKLVSCIPIIGLLIAGRLLYQKSLMKKEYAKLNYIPSQKCTNITCSRLDPSHLNLAISISIFGGLGLLFPIMILVGSVLLIMNLYSKIASHCRGSQSY